MSPTVSVCLPVFNGEKYLAEAIESVLAQTYTDFELLISDDCSRDSSREVIERYARQDSRILSWKNRQNKGLFGNYNETLRRASGRYIKLFAQDDLFEPDMLASSVNVLSQQPNVVLVSSARRFIGAINEDVTEQVLVPSATEYFAGDMRVPGLDVVQRSVMPVVNFIGEPSTVTFRATAVGNGFDCRFYQLGDLEYWLRILHEGDFWYMDRHLCSFRQHAQSRTSSNFRGVLFIPDQLKLWRKFAATLQMLGFSEHEFFDSAVKAMSEEVAHLADNDCVTVESLRSTATLGLCSDGASESDLVSQATHLRLTADLLDFREVAFHALRLLSRVRHSSRMMNEAAVLEINNLVEMQGHHENRSRMVEVKARAKRIKYLERTLRQLLSSPSWRTTRLLREFNRRLLQRAHQPYDGEQAEDSILMQDSYITHLRQQIRLIKRSRSWKLTQFLRLRT